jgi:hypothetical protein
VQERVPTFGRLASKALTPVRTIGSWIEFYGGVIEAIGKGRAILLADARDGDGAEGSGSARAQLFRHAERLSQGTSRWSVIRAFIPFYNVYAQGIAKDLRAHDESEVGRRVVVALGMTDGLMAMLKALAVSGVARSGAEVVYDGMSEYDRTNYNCIPIGWSPGGDYGKRVTYVRFAIDESGRVPSAMLYKLITGIAKHDRRRQ